MMTMPEPWHGQATAMARHCTMSARGGPSLSLHSSSLQPRCATSVQRTNLVISCLDISGWTLLCIRYGAQTGHVALTGRRRIPCAGMVCSPLNDVHAYRGVLTFSSTACKWHSATNMLVLDVTSPVIASRIRSPPRRSLRSQAQQQLFVSWRMMACRPSQWRLGACKQRALCWCCQHCTSGAVPARRQS